MNPTSGKLFNMASNRMVNASQPDDIKSDDILPGDVIWVDLSPVVGKEQAGRRPAVVISSTAFLDVVADLVIVLPATTTDRGWPNHILLTGPHNLPQKSWAMTEQPRTISRTRIHSKAGKIDANCLAEMMVWVRDFLA